VDPITRRRKSLFSNTLVLPGFNLYEALKIDEPKKLEWRHYLFDFRGRHLEYAVFDGADLDKTDLTGAWLQGASLDFASLKGVWLNFANLQGASLVNAHLQGAVSDRAHLQGAWLYLANLQGAVLDRAHLRGASLHRARLQGASLNGSDLQGASLESAQLQGASLVGATVSATDIRRAFLWRTQWGGILPERLKAFQLKDATWKPVWHEENSFFNSDPNEWNAKAYAELRNSMNSIPEGELRDNALAQIKTLDCGNRDKNLASCNPTAAPPPIVSAWQEKLAAANVADVAYAEALAKELKSLVCANDDNAIHILRGIIGNGRLSEAPALVDFILSKNCLVSVSLTDNDKAKLLEIKQAAEKESAPAPPPKKEK
jgi:uncharacterized protein YjbI with pentapeptide repeats